VPDEILQRATRGTPEPGDIDTIATALGLQLDPETRSVSAIAGEQAALDAAAFGPPPAEISEAVADQLAVKAVREIEEPADRVPLVDVQERFEAIERIVRQQQPLGPQPKKPVTLTQFLAGNGGLADDGGELAAMGLSRKFVPGSGALVRKKGKRLDMAREAAAEAGYFDDIYGDPDRAVAESTVDDLLRLLRQDVSGEPVYSPRNDGGRNFEWLAFEQRQKAQEAYRQLVGRIDMAAQDIGLERIDDAIVVRAAELVDDETDELAALERALDEDYRSYADAYTETGAEPFDDLDIPFFNEDARPGPQAGRADGGARADGEPAGGRTDAPDLAQLSRPGGDEGSQSLLAVNATPEPGTAEAGEIAALAVTEAAGRAAIPAGDAAPEIIGEGELRALLSENGDDLGKAGDAVRARVKAALDEGSTVTLWAEGKPRKIVGFKSTGMVDEKGLPWGVGPLLMQKPGGTDRIEILRLASTSGDMWDAMPAGKQADGTVSHVTHAELVEDADRDDMFGDLISSCKD
jgi:hypothetical protein